MRSHMMNFCAEKKEENKGKVNPFENCHQQIDQGDDFQSSSASSSSSDGEDEEREEKGILCYGLMREKQKGFCVSQDRESETDSSNNKLKRVRKLRTSGMKSKKSDYFEQSSEMVEPEPLSSISDTTPEENVAYCLMMLSRDKWKRKESEDEEEEEDSGVVYRNLIGLLDQQKGPNKALKTKARGKYRCETCNKVFRSYQALGGHRASHKKIKVDLPLPKVALKTRNKANAGGGSTVAASVEVEEEKVHECPVCYRVFSSGQALGGHKRSHFIGAAAISSSTTSIKPFSRLGETLNIDLNLPAPIDDDEEISQVEISAISEAVIRQPH